MEKKLLHLFCVLLPVFLASCAVISPQIRSEALPDMPLPQLIANVKQYTGKTVILGGYILETKNDKDMTRIYLIQTPLWSDEMPKAKDFSEGRVIVEHKGFLDPEIYSKERRITVAGIIRGTAVDKDQCPVACLVLESREIYLWPEYEYRSPYYYDPFYGDPYYPYPPPYYWGYPYRGYYPYRRPPYFW